MSLVSFKSFPEKPLAAAFSQCPPHCRVTPQPLHAGIAVDLIESDGFTFLPELGLWPSLGELEEQSHFTGLSHLKKYNYVKAHRPPSMFIQVDPEGRHLSSPYLRKTNRRSNTSFSTSLSSPPCGCFQSKLVKRLFSGLCAVTLIKSLIKTCMLIQVSA